MRLGLIIIVLTVAADQISKFLAFTDLSEGLPVAVTSFFNWVKVWNTGVSFSMFNNHGQAGAVVLSVFALGVAAFLFRWMTKENDRLKIAALALIIGGAVGNVELGAQLMGHAMVQAQARGVEGQAGQSGGHMHLLPGMGIVVVQEAAQQVAAADLNCLLRQGSAELVIAQADIALQGVGEHVHAGVGGDGGGNDGVVSCFCDATCVGGGTDECCSGVCRRSA